MNNETMKKYSSCQFAPSRASAASSRGRYSTYDYDGTVASRWNFGRRCKRASYINIWLAERILTTKTIITIIYIDGSRQGKRNCTQ